MTESSSFIASKNQMEISFDNSDETYLTGQVVTGKLVLKLSQVISGDLVIKFQGQVRTSFDKKLNKRLIVSLSGQETLLDHVVHTSTRIFNAGDHEIPVIYHLPKELASSYEGPHGYTKFWCTATLKYSDTKMLACSKFFTILSPVDLNSAGSIPSAPSVTKKSEKKSLSCIIQQRFQQIYCALEKSAFVPGDDLSVHCIVDNKKSKPILSLGLTLKQCVKFSGTSKKTNQSNSKEVTFLLSNITDSTRIEVGDSKKCNLRLKIPPVPPSTLHSTKSLIEISYSAEIKCGNRLVVNLPFIVGTVPIGTTMDDLHEQVAPLRKSSRNVDALFAPSSSTPCFKENALRNCRNSFRVEDAQNCCNQMSYVPKYLYFEKT